MKDIKKDIMELRQRAMALELSLQADSERISKIYKMIKEFEQFYSESSKAVEVAFSELDSVQLCDNTAAEADEARKEIKQIIRDLAKRLTIK